MIEQLPPGEALEANLDRFQALPCGCVPALRERRCFIALKLAWKIDDSRENWTPYHASWFVDLLKQHIEGRGGREGDLPIERRVRG